MGRAWAGLARTELEEEEEEVEVEQEQEEEEEGEEEGRQRRGIRGRATRAVGRIDPSQGRQFAAARVRAAG